MSGLIFACLWVCFAQNALGQVLGLGNGLGPGPCAGGHGFPNGLGAGPYPGNLAMNGFAMGGLPISGVTPIGYGDVNIAGELPVGGNTAVAGNVPIIGYVMFEGIVPAGGIASIANNCGCNGPMIY